MKKKIALPALAAGIIFLTGSLGVGLVRAAGTYEAIAIYNMENATITIRGKASDNAKLSIFVVPSDVGISGLSDSNLPSDVTLATTRNGVFEKGIKLSETLSGGEYTAYIFGAAGTESVSFMHANLAQANLIVPTLSEIIEKKQGAATLASAIRDNASDLAIGEQIISNNLMAVAELLVNNPKKYSTALEFMEAFNEALACVLINLGQVEETLVKYSTEIGIDFNADYNAYPDELKQHLNTLLISYDYRTELIGSVYHKLLVLAKVQKSDRWSTIKDVVLENATIIGADISPGSTYDRIKDKDAVFGEMFLSTQDEFSDIKAHFEAAVKKVYDNENKPVTGGNTGGNTGGGGGGGGSSSSIIMSADKATIAAAEPVIAAPEPEQTPEPEATPQPTPEAQAVFSDVVSHWAKEQIEHFAQLGIVNGFEDGSFKPDQAVTRAQFAKIFAIAFQLEVADGDYFTDVDASDSMAGYIYSVYNEGVVTGYDNQFSPNEFIKREDAAVMIYRYLSAQGKIEDNEASFQDYDDISEYARQAVSSLAHAGIMKGSDGYVNPHGQTTRAEAVTLINNIMNM